MHGQSKVTGRIRLDQPGNPLKTPLQVPTYLYRFV